MTEQEKLMYQVLHNLSSTNQPIVFLGALVTKAILSNNGFEDVLRATRDIDANWIGDKPSMQHLVDVVDGALSNLPGNYEAVAYRNHDEGVSAGLQVIDKDAGFKVFDVDIDISSVAGVQEYHYGDVMFKGVLPNEILADKLCVLSSSVIFRRAKDLIDIYSLSHCVDVGSKDIFDVCKHKGNEIKSFEEFYNRKDDLEHSYNKLRGVLGKPDFSEVYAHLDTFIKPFVNKDATPQWSCKTKEWVSTS